jgi:hypothetical protein
LLGLAWIVAVGAAVRPASGQILAQAYPVEYNLTVKPGEWLTRVVAIRNLSQIPVVVRVRLSDWRMNQADELDLVPAGTTPVSLRGLVLFEPAEFSIGPAQTGRVHLTMHLPSGGPATRWGVLLSEVRPARRSKVSFGPRAVAELGTQLYLSRIPAEQTRAQLTGMDVRSLGDSSFTVDVYVQNSGDRHLFSSGEITVTDSTGVEVASGTLATRVVLPRALRVFAWRCDAPVAPGRYSVTVSLDTGEPELLVGEMKLGWPLSRGSRGP